MIGYDWSVALDQRWVGCGVWDIIVEDGAFQGRRHPNYLQADKLVRFGHRTAKHYSQ